MLQLFLYLPKTKKHHDGNIFPTARIELRIIINKSVLDIFICRINNKVTRLLVSRLYDEGVCSCVSAADLHWLPPPEGVRHPPVQYSTVQYRTVQYRTVQNSTEQNSTIQYRPVNVVTLSFLLHLAHLPHALLALLLRHLRRYCRYCLDIIDIVDNIDIIDIDIHLAALGNRHHAARGHRHQPAVQVGHLHVLHVTCHESQRVT